MCDVSETGQAETGEETKRRKAISQTIKKEGKYR